MNLRTTYEDASRAQRQQVTRLHDHELAAIHAAIRANLRAGNHAV